MEGDEFITDRREGGLKDTEESGKENEKRQWDKEEEARADCLTTSEEQYTVFRPEQSVAFPCDCLTAMLMPH